MKKKWWWILCLSLVLVFGSTLTAHAAGDSISEATSISTGKTYSGTISESNTADYYKFTISTSGSVTFTSSAYFERVEYYLYDASADELWSTSVTYDSNTGVSNYTKTTELTSGTYYLMFCHSNGKATVNDGGYGTYQFKVSFTSAGESFKETQGGSNNTLAASSSISTGKTYYGQIAQNDTQDFYKFTISSSGTVTLKGVTYFERVAYYLYDANGSELWSTTSTWDSTSGVSNYTNDLVLTKGTYYLLLAHSDGKATVNDGGYGNYTIKLTFTSASESFSEPNGGNNNSISAADSISLNKSYKGQIALNDTEDYYKFKLTKKNTITLASTAYTEKMTYKIFDSSGTQVWESTPSYDSSTGKIKLSEELTLSKGTYYLAVIHSSGYGNYSVKIKSSFTKSNVTLSKTTFTYSGKKKTPTITVVNAAGTTLKEGTDYTLSYSSSSRKSIGKYTVTIKGKGDYAGSSVKKTFKIKPKQVSVKSAKSSSSKKLTVKWSKVSGSVKYQIAYKVKGGSWKYKTVSSKTYSKTLTGLKSGKTYYVKVRAVKTVDSTKYYGSWSSTTKVKVK